MHNTPFYNSRQVGACIRRLRGTKVTPEQQVTTNGNEGMADEQQPDLSSGLEPTPGVYRFRARRKAPWQPVKIMFDGWDYHVLVTGEVVFGSGKPNPMDIPLLRERWPLHPISDREYGELMDAYANAKPGSPLLSPNEPINLRGSPAL